MAKLVPQPQADLAFGLRTAKWLPNAGGIDDHARGTALDDQVVRLGLRIQLEAVLKTAAAAGQDGNAKSGFGGLVRLGDDLGNASGGTVSEGKLFHALR